MVQIRVQRAYPGRIRAGAPVPTRSMTQAELLANLRYFTVEMEGPRSRPCSRLVLSGVGVASRAQTPALLTQGRTWGVRHVVLHVGREDLEGFDPTRYAGLVDAIVVPVQIKGGARGQPQALTRRCQALGIQVAANVVLSAGALPDLPQAAQAILDSGVARASFSYPFPIAGNPSRHVPPVQEVMAALGPAVTHLERAGVSVSVKGLPACYLGPLARLTHRSSNRWYVDADHQRENAVLFFPRVVSFTKGEACRFCSLDAQCDGFFETYLRRPGFPALEPVQG